MTVPVKIQTPANKEPDELSLGTQECDLELLFTNLATKSWNLLRLVLQRRADIFVYNKDKTAALAGFKLTTKNTRKVLDLYLRVHRWKSVVVRIKGVDIDTLSEANKWIHCWIMAHAFDDKDDWCILRDFDPQLYTGITSWWDYITEEHTWIEDRVDLPCKCVHWRPNTTKPGMYKSQYAAAARTMGCDKCPFYNINKFKQYVVNTDPDLAIEQKKQ